MFYDCEIFAHDSLFVFIHYRTHERFIFHNAYANDFQEFIDKYNPILVGYNNNGYDKYMLKLSLLGYTPEELKKANDYIISGGNGWEIDNTFVKLPTQVDLMNCIVPRKSLKELEGNIRLNITETTISFDLPTKWTKQQYEEVLYYCTCDVEALFPIFEMLKTKFISSQRYKKYLKFQSSFQIFKYVLYNRNRPTVSYHLITLCPRILFPFFVDNQCVIIRQSLKPFRFDRRQSSEF